MHHNFIFKAHFQNVVWHLRNAQQTAIYWQALQLILLLLLHKLYIIGLINIQLHNFIINQEILLTLYFNPSKEGNNYFWIIKINQGRILSKAFGAGMLEIHWNRCNNIPMKSLKILFDLLRWSVWYGLDVNWKGSLVNQSSRLPGVKTWRRLSFA